jgi:hypothetical protein
MSTDLPYKTNTIIKRDNSGWTLPAALTPAANAVLMKTIEDHGDLIAVEESVDTLEMADRILKNNKDSELALELKRVMTMTLVVFNGDHRNSAKTEFNYSIVGGDLDDAEALITAIYDNEILKTKYQDNNIRRASVFNSEGGELKSTCFTKQKQNIKNSNIKNN